MTAIAGRRRCRCRCRDFFLRPQNYAGCGSLLVQRFGELVRKVWNPRAFKGQVSPHEFMQARDCAPQRRAGGGACGAEMDMC